MRCLLLSIALVVACSSKKHSDDTPVVVADPKKARAAYDAKDWKKCAELWLAVAASTTGEATTGPLYNAACCHAQAGDLDAAFAALQRAIVAGFQLLELQNDNDLVPLHADPRWPAILELIRHEIARAEAAVQDPALRQEILALERERALATPDHVHAVEIEARTTARLEAIIAKHGWPGKTLVGKDGARAAWQIVQHSRNADFQAACLEKLELAVTQGEADAIEHAYLYDRVAVNAGKPQRWGTQLDGLTPYPIEDETHVDKRRKAIGLSSMAEQREMVREKQLEDDLE